MRLQLVAEQMTRLQQEMSSLQRKSKKARAGMDSNPKPERLIPKPPGAAGKRNGYQVQEAMGLGDDKRQYNALMYLDLDKTCRGQDENEIALVVMKVQKKHPFLRKFRNAWPVRDWIQQFLCNHVNDHRHRLGQGNKVWGYSDDEESEELDDDEDEDQDEHEDPGLHLGPGLCLCLDPDEDEDQDPDEDEDQDLDWAEGENEDQAKGEDGEQDEAQDEDEGQHNNSDLETQHKDQDEHIDHQSVGKDEDNIDQQANTAYELFNVPPRLVKLANKISADSNKEVRPPPKIKAPRSGKQKMAVDSDEDVECPPLKKKAPRSGKQKMAVDSDENVECPPPKKKAPRPRKRKMVVDSDKEVEKRPPQKKQATVPPPV
ncbi:hypothetical protein C8R48DRAFT_669225 [Suillus tomentosus]|nr:hypothetical protein C8R48DRAFT_669225 [Suillus tomentosus]